MAELNLQWSSTVYSDSGYAGAVHHGDDGQISVTGYTETGGINSDDTIISKYSTSGTQQWITTTQQTGYDVGREIKTGSDGSTYTIGVFDGTFYGDVAGVRDAYLLKTDTNGNYAWSTPVAKGSSTQEGESLYVDSDGYIYVTGSTVSNLGAQTNSGGEDIFVEKYSSSGAKQWSKLIGTAGDETGEAIRGDANGNIYITGTTTGALSGENNNGGSDAFLIKMSASGTEQWTKLLGGSGNETTTAIAISSDGSIYTAGSSDGSLLAHINQGDKDTLTAKYSTNGTLIWADLIGTSSFERARGITLGSDSYIYISGNFDQDLMAIQGPGMEMHL